MIPRPRRITAAAALAIVVAACSATKPDPAPEVDDGATPPATLKRAMKRLNRHFEVVDAELSKTPAGDLRAVADAATAGAALVRHGYGKLRVEDVKNFDRMARDCESWLVRIAAEAGQGHGAIAQDLFRGGEERYCTRCHDASGAQQW